MTADYCHELDVPSHYTLIFSPTYLTVVYYFQSSFRVPKVEECEAKPLNEPPPQHEGGMPGAASQVSSMILLLLSFI